MSRHLSEADARNAVELEKLRLCSAALVFVDEAKPASLILAASRYAAAVSELRRAQRREVSE